MCIDDGFLYLKNRFDCMDVSVIIVNYNTLDITKKCIDSLFEKTKDISFEGIVVDNASKDGSYECFFYDDRIIYKYLPENLGFGRANNIGINLSKGRNVLFLNSDTVLLNNAVKILSDFLDLNLNVGACGGNLYDGCMNPAQSYRMMLPSVAWELNSLFNNFLEKICWGRNTYFNHTGKVLEVGYIIGADMMVKRKVLDEVGFFSNEFFMYYEETELTFRIKRAGYNVISIPDSRIQHLEGKSFGYQKISENRIKCLEESRCKYYKLCSSSLVRKITSVIYCLNIFIRFVVFCLLLSFNKIAYYSLKMKYFCLASRKC